jgi:hypothetical protein
MFKRTVVIPKPIKPSGAGLARLSDIRNLLENFFPFIKFLFLCQIEKSEIRKYNFLNCTVEYSIVEPPA